MRGRSPKQSRRGACSLDCRARSNERLARNDGGTIVIANPKGEAIQRRRPSRWIAAPALMSGSLAMTMDN
ncbi:MAG: hypothetical protein LBT00_15065 [Spirochaetaceae bacterium]|nr:hypothetical protein [Spirochaetaceae bacterium]